MEDIHTDIIRTITFCFLYSYKKSNKLSDSSPCVTRRIYIKGVYVKIKKTKQSDESTKGVWRKINIVRYNCIIREQSSDHLLICSGPLNKKTARNFQSTKNCFHTSFGTSVDYDN